MSSAILAHASRSAATAAAFHMRCASQASTSDEFAVGPTHLQAHSVMTSCLSLDLKIEMGGAGQCCLKLDAPEVRSFGRQAPLRLGSILLSS